jgi:hypothetical protein
MQVGLEARGERASESAPGRAPNAAADDARRVAPNVIPNAAVSASAPAPGRGGRPWLSSEAGFRWRPVPFASHRRYDDRPARGDPRDDRDLRDLPGDEAPARRNG